MRNIPSIFSHKNLEWIKTKELAGNFKLKLNLKRYMHYDRRMRTGTFDLHSLQHRILRNKMSLSYTPNQFVELQFKSNVNTFIKFGA